MFERVHEQVREDLNRRKWFGWNIGLSIRKTALVAFLLLKTSKGRQEGTDTYLFEPS